MSPKRIHLIRHAQSLHNAMALTVADENTIKIDPALRDAALSPLGHQQAQALRSEMATVDGIELIIVSPFTRAIQTTLHAFGDTRVPRIVHDLHRERLDSFCDVGRSPTALAQDFPMLDFTHLDDPWWYTVPGATEPFTREPMDILDQRVSAFTDYLQSLPEDCIAVVGHSTFLRTLAGRPFANAERFEMTI